MAPHPAHGSARRLTLLASVAFLSIALWLLAAGPTVACSCVQPQPMAAYGTGDNVVFSGTAGPRDARGVPVRVATWFSGRGPAPVVYLAASSFGDGSACGTGLPAAGTDWIWVAFLPEGGGDPVTGLCEPHGQLGTPEGDAMLADAVATYGGAPATGPPGAVSESPASSATAPPAGAPTSPAASSDPGLPILLGTIGLGLAVLLVAVVIARRRTAGGG